jgi:F-type H+-transporting ATPase subunit delta
MNNSLFFNYATALLDVCKDEKKDLVELRGSIKFMMQTFQKNRDFAKFFTFRNISYEEKCNVLEKIFEGCDELLLNFLKLLIVKNRAFYIYDILKESLSRFDVYLNLETGTIYSPEPLSIENLEKIRCALEQRKNKRIELVNEIDKSLIGGFVIKLSGDIYDTSIKTKIERMKKVLKEGE